MTVDNHAQSQYKIQSHSTFDTDPQNLNFLFSYHRLQLHIRTIYIVTMVHVQYIHKLIHKIMDIKCLKA